MTPLALALGVLEEFAERAARDDGYALDSIGAEMARAKAHCRHAWAPWLGKAACCSRCGLLCTHMPRPTAVAKRGRRIARALADTRARVEGMLR